MVGRLGYWVGLLREISACCATWRSHGGEMWLSVGWFGRKTACGVTEQSHCGEVRSLAGSIRMVIFPLCDWAVALLRGVALGGLDQGIICLLCD